MLENPYQKGYRQGKEDGEQKKKFRPQKLRNLHYLVFAGNKGNSAFIKGYTLGYRSALKKSLAQEGSPSSKGISKHPHEEAQKSSPNRLERLQQSRSQLRNAPEQEPEY